MGAPIHAKAILDKLLHHTNIINIRGNSYHLKDGFKPGYMSANAIISNKKG